MHVNNMQMHTEVQGTRLTQSFPLLRVILSRLLQAALLYTVIIE